MSVKFGSWPRAAIVWVVVLLGLASSASAQTSAQVTAQSQRPGTPEFARRVDGKDVIVRVTDGREYVGVFVIQGETLVSRGQKATTTVPFDQIVRVRVNSYRIRLHTLIGVGVGAGVGVLMLSRCGECDGFGFFFIASGAGIGSGVGASVGGILNSINSQADLIYDNHQRTVAWSIAPILSPTRRGAALTLRWR